MKGKAIAALVAITAVIAVAMFAGCVDEEAPEYILISQKDLVLTRFISTEYGTTEADGLRSVELLDGGTTRGKIVFMIPETEHVECSGDFDTGYYNIKFEKDTGDTRG
jgi:hypothetical protein